MKRQNTYDGSIKLSIEGKSEKSDRKLSDF